MTKLIDCAFFLTSSCLMGYQCRYRHSEEAKSTQIVCPLFKERKCFAVSCKFRHPKNNQKDIPCMYESKPVNPYIIDPTLSVQSEVGEKNTQNIAADSQEKIQLHRLLTAPDLYSTAYNAAARRTPQDFKYKKVAMGKRFSNVKKENEVMGKRKFSYETEDESKKFKADTGIANKENKVCCVKDLRPFNDPSKIPHRIPAILDS
ncbi:hypothetical protein TNCT_364641 [Trichonephila clavata]|uniref:C3H1-type domain-containing protein n=1 Tax=Trichonephila clavata TaxID=2740835 RepID=A0A8X6EZB3_TRICU|nr:hypothetical protein TNCT_364641 [Trichonephila clavata]